MQEQNLNTVFNFILNKKYRWLFHIVFWLIIFSVDINSLIEQGFSGCLTCSLLIFLIEMLIVYINIYLLFSIFLVKGKIYRYMIYTAIFIGIYVAIHYFMFYEEHIIEYFDEDTGETETIVISVIGSLIVFAFRIFSIIGTAIGIKFFKQYFIEQRKLNHIKQDSLENELEYLKNQINPHFLFNSLNNIYVQSKKSLPQTSDSILLLSNLLRYQLYDCAKDTVSLEHEVDYLKNFLKLEELRKKTSNISLQVNGQTSHIRIAPFIFMPFVENAIKYSSLTDMPLVNIEFNIKDSKVLFKVENNKQNSFHVKKDEGGIGLSNVKRRLDLLYPNSHELILNESEERFVINLTLNTKEFNILTQ